MKANKRINNWASRHVVAYAAYRNHDPKDNWRGRSVWFWYRGLIGEVIELGLTLLGLHKGPLQLEITQIGAIAINLLLELERQGKLK